MIQYDTQEELTLRDVLLGIFDYLKEFWRLKWLIIAGAALGAALFLWRARQQPVTYTASLTFMLNNDEGSGAGGLASILGSVGLGVNNGAEYNLNKIVELSKSQLIIQQVLLDSIVVDGERDLLAHHLIDVYELNTEWAENGKEEWVDLRFSMEDPERFQIPARKLLQYLHGRIVGNSETEGFVRLQVDNLTSILKLKATTISETLSAELAEKVFEHLSAFYIDKITASPQRTVESLRMKTDSLRQLLSSTEYSLANRRDATLGLIQRRDQVTVEQLTRQVAVLNVIYGEVVKNLATAEFTLSNVTPFFAVIDRPFLPLNKSSVQSIPAILLGGVIGGSIVLLIIGLRKLLLDTLSNDPTSH